MKRDLVWCRKVLCVTALSTGNAWRPPKNAGGCDSWQLHCMCFTHVAAVSFRSSPSTWQLGSLQSLTESLNKGRVWSSWVAAELSV